MTIEEIKECKSYSDAIKLIFNKNYTNGKLQEKVRVWCLDNFNFNFEEHLENYKNRKVYCLNCGKEIDGKDRFRKKFCNSSCAATYNNKQRTSIPNECNAKISATLLKKNAAKNDLSVEEYVSIPRTKNRKLKHLCICKVCGKEFYSAHNATYCSSKCSNSDPEVKQKLRDKVLERIESGTFSGWKSRNITSYPEQFWIEVLNNNSIPFVREDFTTNKYFLDFLIEKNGKKIDLEIDGKQHMYNDRIKHDKERDEFLKNNGYIVYRIPWNSINTEEGSLQMKSKVDAFLEFYKNL